MLIGSGMHAPRRTLGDVQPPTLPGRRVPWLAASPLLTISSPPTMHHGTSRSPPPPITMTTLARTLPLALLLLLSPAVLGRRLADVPPEPTPPSASSAADDASTEPPAFFSLTLAERLELVDLSEHTELVAAPRSGGSGPALNVGAALAAGYSPRTVTFLSDWYTERASESAAAAPAAAPRSLPAGAAPRSLPSAGIKLVLKSVARNWSKIVGVVEKVLGRAAAAKYFNLGKFQGALEAALGASDALEAAVTIAVSFLLPSWLQWAVAPLVWALLTFVSPI